MADSYPNLKVNTVHRLRNRGAYDHKTIHGIVNACPVVHVSFTPDAPEPFPATLPMIGQMGSFQDQSAGVDEPLDCYLHGSISSRIMRLAQEAIGQGHQGLPVCIAATKIDGYVLALAPFHHSYNFRSAILHGYAQTVEDEDEKLWAMQLITNSVVPERWDNSRTPPTKTEMLSTRILRVKIFTGSAKLRTGLPHDDRHDLRDENVQGRIWAGVVPVWEMMGDPIPAPYNGPEMVPDHVKVYIRQTNEQNKESALNAAKEPESA